MSNIIWPTYNEVYELYINQNMRRKDVADLLNVSDRLLKKILSTYGIKKDRKKVYELMSDTLLKTRGVCNPWALPENIKKSHSPEVERRRVESNKQTCLERYGVTNGGGTPEALKKIKATMKERYGVDNYLKLESVRKLAQTEESKVLRKQHTIETNNIKYGCDYWWQSDDYKTRFRSPEQVKKYKEKEISTKRANGTMNYSQPEEDLYKELCDQYGIDDVLRQYKCDRYPFFCDFYIPSKDLFIELNAHWTHGSHPFDETNELDLERLAFMKQKAETSDFYKTAIYVWTILDPLKCKIAKDNNLNIDFIY